MSESYIPNRISRILWLSILHVYWVHHIDVTSTHTNCYNRIYHNGYSKTIRITKIEPLWGSFFNHAMELNLI